ncbi:hypothetical protein niasHS_015931 [Heterodera schachtii]|uniref:THAP4-like heme-binding domain-containing protein n=1 Tax=Heterodera schachtii TaxID=97005 RepID=A0ABD2HQM9_HETSC
MSTLSIRNSAILVHLCFGAILHFGSPELLPSPTDVTDKPSIIRYWTYPPSTKALPTTTTTTETTTTNTTTTTTTTMTTMTPRPPPKKCQDIDMNCFTWVAENPDSCEQDTEVLRLCRRSCQMCGKNYTVEVPDNEVEEMYDIRRVPAHLQRLAFLIGRWQSDFGGKADFPTIPRFTYGEKLDFSVSTHLKQSVLNYSAFAWDNSDLTELHSEHGFLLGWPNSSAVALNTVMSNGFVTVEKGEESDHSIRFELDQIGRINFSRDLPVRRVKNFLPIKIKLFSLGQMAKKRKNDAIEN